MNLVPFFWLKKTVCVCVCVNWEKGENWTGFSWKGDITLSLMNRDQKINYKTNVFDIISPEISNRLLFWNLCECF